MKNLFTSTVLIFSSTLVAAQATNTPADCVTRGVVHGNTYNGMVSCKEGTLEKMNVNGPLELSDVTIKKDLEVNGPVKLDQINIGDDLEVTGPLSATEVNVMGELKAIGTVELKNSQINKTSKIKGPLTAEQSIFNDKLSIYTNELTLSNSQTKGIEIKNNDGINLKSQIVYLQGKTIVDGDIEFSSTTPGKLECSNEAIIKGKVVNGSTENCKNVK